MSIVEIMSFFPECMVSKGYCMHFRYLNFNFPENVGRIRKKTICTAPQGESSLKISALKIQPFVGLNNKHTNSLISYNCFIRKIELIELLINKHVDKVSSAGLFDQRSN